jgi:hypothetical protein
MKWIGIRYVRSFLLIFQCILSKSLKLKETLYKKLDTPEKNDVSLSVADPGFFYISDPRSWFLPTPDLGSRIPDPKTATKERGEKKIVVTFFVAKNFTKLNIILFLKCWRKKWANFHRIIEVFTPKIVTKLSKIRVWDLRSGIRIQGSKRH